MKAKFRTINECLEELRRIDSETAITYNFIKNLCTKRRIKTYTCGKKIIINLNELFKYLDIKVD